MDIGILFLEQNDRSLAPSLPVDPIIKILGFKIKKIL